MSFNSSELLIRFLKHLQHNGIAYCLVGNTDDFPDSIKGDADIIISQNKIINIHSVILSFCKEAGVSVVQCLQHENNAFYYVIQWYESNKPEFLKLDICGDYYRKAFLFLKADELLANVREARDKQGNSKNFLVAEPATEFLYYFLKKIDKGSLDDEQALHLHNQWKKNPDGCYEKISRFWGKNDCNLIKKAAERNDWVSVIKGIPKLKKSIHKKVHITPEGLWGEFQRRVRRVIYPTGLTVAIMGPDGCGKSSVLEAVAESLAPAFRKKARYHLRPYILPARTSVNSEAVINPHAHKEYNVIISMIKIFYLWLDYFIGHFTVIRWKKIFSTFVFFDRYFFDIWADPKRFRYGGPLWLVTALSKILPSPDVLIFLDAPADIIQQRKQEVSYDECARQVESYKQVAGYLKKAVIIDTTQTLDDVVARVNKFALDILNKRTEERLRKLICRLDKT